MCRVYHQQTKNLAKHYETPPRLRFALTTPGLARRPSALLARGSNSGPGTTSRAPDWAAPVPDCFPCMTLLDGALADSGGGRLIVMHPGNRGNLNSANWA